MSINSPISTLKARIEREARLYHPHTKNKTLQETINKMTSYSGPGIHFTLPATTLPDAAYPRQMALWLASKAPALEQKWLGVKTACFSKNEKLIIAFREEIKLILKTLAENPPKGIPDVVMKSFVGQMICRLIMTDPDVGETVTWPEQQGSRWIPATRTLTAALSQLGKHTTYAWEGENLTPVLTFTPTHMPQGRGFINSLLSDCTPFCAPGNVSEEVLAWIQKHPGVQLIGESLGGINALRAAQALDDLVGSVWALNPPGAYPTWWSGDWEKPLNCFVEIFSNEGDVVSTMGYLPTGENVHFYHLIQGQEGKSENTLAAHAKAYGGAEYVTILKTSTVYENHRLGRHLITLLHFILAPLIFIPAALFYLVKELLSILVSFIYFPIKRFSAAQADQI